MTITYNTVQEVYNRNYGSEKLYKRDYCNTLLYTQGIMDFQQTLNAFWVVDNVVSYMPKILKAYEDNTFSFFVIEIALNKNQQGYMEVFTEDYIEGVYNEHILILKQDIPFIDLPTKEDEEITTYRFYLEISSFEPINFTLFLPSEY